MEMECKSFMLMVNPEEICQESSSLLVQLHLILVLTMEGSNYSVLVPELPVTIYRYNLDKDQLLKAWDR